MNKDITEMREVQAEIWRINGIHECPSISNIKPTKKLQGSIIINNTELTFYRLVDWRMQ